MRQRNKDIAFNLNMYKTLKKKKFKYCTETSYLLFKYVPYIISSHGKTRGKKEFF